MRILLAWLLLRIAWAESDGALNEQDRIEQYHERNHTWPREDYVPNTEGWSRLMRTRLQQIQEIENLNDRYMGWHQVSSTVDSL
jgi:hypothetical protein